MTNVMQLTRPESATLNDSPRLERCMTEQKKVRIDGEELLSDNWYILKKINFALQLRNGEWQQQTREVYDRGNGAVILLYTLTDRTILLPRQFRIPAFMNGHSGFLIEA